jgi:hypothetical protein
VPAGWQTVSGGCDTSSPAIPIVGPEACEVTQGERCGCEDEDVEVRVPPVDARRDLECPDRADHLEVLSEGLPGGTLLRAPVGALNGCEKRSEVVTLVVGNGKRDEVEGPTAPGVLVGGFLKFGRAPVADSGGADRAGVDRTAELKVGKVSDAVDQVDGYGDGGVCTRATAPADAGEGGVRPLEASCLEAPAALGGSWRIVVAVVGYVGHAVAALKPTVQ